MGCTKGQWEGESREALGARVRLQGAQGEGKGKARLPTRRANARGSWLNEGDAGGEVHGARVKVRHKGRHKGAHRMLIIRLVWLT
jgi:hypothetical protein